MTSDTRTLQLTGPDGSVLDGFYVNADIQVLCERHAIDGNYEIDHMLVLHVACPGCKVFCVLCEREQDRSA